LQRALYRPVRQTLRFSSFSAVTTRSTSCGESLSLRQRDEYLPVRQTRRFSCRSALSVLRTSSAVSQSRLHRLGITEAALHEAELLRLAGPTQHAYSAGEVYSAAGTLHLRKGDWSTARSLYGQSIAALQTGNIAIMRPGAVAASAWVLAQGGEPSEALTRLREGEQLLELQAAQGPAQGLVFTAYQALGRAALLLDRLDEAQSLGERAVRSSVSRYGIAAQALHLLGDIASHPDRFDAERGEAYYRKALALAEPRGMRPLIAHCHLGLAKLYRRTDDGRQAREHLSTATTMYREMNMPYWLEQAEAEVRELA